MERSWSDVARSFVAVVLSVALAWVAWSPLAFVVWDGSSLGPWLSLTPFVVVPPTICALVLLNSPHKHDARWATGISYCVICVSLLVGLVYLNLQSGG